MKGKISVLMFIMGAFILFNAVSCSKGGSDDDGTGGGGTNPPTTGGCSGTAGPLYLAVDTLVKNRCVSCHNSTLANGGVNFTASCAIVDKKARIKVRVVDEGTMPQTGALPQREKDIITAWINAGGLYTN
jgi:uncharacterized membrane protein